MKRSAFKKKKTTTSTKADQLFSRWIRDRDLYCFFSCGRPSIQNSHFWNRYHSATRYDPENCDGICGRCHMMHEGDKQGLYRQLKLRQLGVKHYDALERRARSIVKRQDAIALFLNWYTLGTPQSDQEQTSR